MNDKQRFRLHQDAEHGSDLYLKAELKNCTLLEVKDLDIGILREQLAESKAETKRALESKFVYFEKRPKMEEPPKKRRRIDFDVKEPPNDPMSLDDFLARCKLLLSQLNQETG